MKYWILNQKWSRRFFISHLSVWFIATLQTLWIVWEIRAAGKRKNKPKKEEDWL